MRDRCIPWDPIPREQNQYFAVVVTAFEETRHENVVAVTLFYSPGEGPEDDGAHVWRITFPRPVGYRMRLIPDWPSTVPFTRPEDRSLALWEVAPSSWLKNALPPNYSVPMRHFVIASEYDVYEVIAESWAAEEISREASG